MFMTACMLCINNYNCCHGNAVTGFSALLDNANYPVLCINYYNRCQDNAVQEFRSHCLHY